MTLGNVCMSDPAAPVTKPAPAAGNPDSAVRFLDLWEANIALLVTESSWNVLLRRRDSPPASGKTRE